MPQLQMEIAQEMLGQDLVEAEGAVDYSVPLLPVGPPDQASYE